jgi:hypothetical protein
VPRAALALFDRLAPQAASRSGIRSPNRYSLNMAALGSKNADRNWKMTATYVEVRTFTRLT